MPVGKFRAISGYLLSFCCAVFGVFIFNGFEYRGLDLFVHILPLFTSTSTIRSGFYQLIGSGLMVNWFAEFTAENIQQHGLSAILFGDAIWPAILAWFATGFVIGIFFCGVKRSIARSLIIFFVILFLWIILGIFAEADLTAIFRYNLTNTLGEFFTALVAILPGAILGGALSRDS